MSFVGKGSSFYPISPRFPHAWLPMIPPLPGDLVCPGHHQLAQPQVNPYSPAPTPTCLQPPGNEELLLYRHFPRWSAWVVWLCCLFYAIACIPWPFLISISVFKGIIMWTPNHKAQNWPMRETKSPLPIDSLFHLPAPQFPPRLLSSPHLFTILQNHEQRTKLRIIPVLFLKSQSVKLLGLSALWSALCPRHFASVSLNTR